METFAFGSYSPSYAFKGDM